MSASNKSGDETKGNTEKGQAGKNPQRGRAVRIAGAAVLGIAIDLHTGHLYSLRRGI